MDGSSPAASAGTPSVRPSAGDAPLAVARRRAGFADVADVDRLVAMLDRFERGEITAEAWGAFSRLQGVYAQRQDGLVMLRAKIPQGVVDATQLRAIAAVADLFSRGFAHFTTRQDVQFHFVHPTDLDPALRVLADAGLTTREACGNSVRNVTACPLAGIAPDEVFDVSPYADAATRHLLRHPLSSSLPRKFKIAFEGCPEDHALTAINDVGLLARVREQEGRPVRGFAVVAGGATGTLPSSARTLFDFLPAADLLALLEAVLRVFDRLGERKNRQAARLKFLVRKMGWEAFRAEVVAELGRVRDAGAPALPFDFERPPAEEPPSWRRAPAATANLVAERAAETVLRGPGLLPIVEPEAPRSAAFTAWLATNVRRQRQPGFVAAAITLPLGDITADQLRILADLARAYGDGTVRATAAQDLLLRWVRAHELSQLYRRLAAAGLGTYGAGTAADVVSCPGAESCPLAVTASRGVARLVEEHLRSRPDLVAAGGDLSIKVSGCPSGCSQHHVAAIGLQGSVRKVGGRAVPQYFLTLGGGVDGAGARFGRLAAKVPARRVAEAVHRLVLLYREERAHGERAADYFARLPLARAREVLADLCELTAATALPADFADPGDEFAEVAALAQGERAA